MLLFAACSRGGAGLSQGWLDPLRPELPMPDPIILIPSRLAATRLPGKPLAEIAGEPMIVHVWRRAVAADCGTVVVATDSNEVKNAVSAVGGLTVMTSESHPSGSDRVFEAVSRLDPLRSLTTVVNLQGDVP